MIALGGPKLKLSKSCRRPLTCFVSMIALGGPKLKLLHALPHAADSVKFQ